MLFESLKKEVARLVKYYKHFARPIIFERPFTSYPGGGGTLMYNYVRL